MKVRDFVELMHHNYLVLKLENGEDLGEYCMEDSPEGLLKYENYEVREIVPKSYNEIVLFVKKNYMGTMIPDFYIKDRLSDPAKEAVGSSGTMGLYWKDGKIYSDGIFAGHVFDSIDDVVDFIEIRTLDMLFDSIKEK